MPSMKRPAAAAAARMAAAPRKAKAPKVANVSEPTVPTAKFPDIVELLRSAEGFPAVVVDMLVACLESAAVPTEERHSAQEAVLGMVEEVLDAHVSATKGRVDAADALLVALKKDCGTREQDVVAAKAMADAADAMLAEKKGHLATALETLAKAQEAEKGAETVKAREAGVLETASADQAKLQKTQEQYDVLRTGNPEPSREALAMQVVEGLRGHKLDESLVASLTAVLAKDLAGVGEFDKMVIAQLETELAKLAEDLSTKARTAAEESERSSQAVQLAATETERVRALVQSAAADVEAAESEVAKQVDAQKKAAAASADAAAKASVADGELVQLRAKLEAVHAGPVQSFRAIKEMRAEEPEDTVQGCGGAAEESVCEMDASAVPESEAAAEPAGAASEQATTLSASAEEPAAEASFPRGAEDAGISDAVSAEGPSGGDVQDRTTM